MLDINESESISSHHLYLNKQKSEEQNIIGIITDI